MGAPHEVCMRMESRLEGGCLFTVTRVATWMPGLVLHVVRLVRSVLCPAATLCPVTARKTP